MNEDTSGMKHRRCGVFRANPGSIALTIFYIGYIGLIFYAVIASSGNDAMPLTYAVGQDVILDSRSISSHSPGGISLIADGDASAGQAMEFSCNANPRAEAHPQTYADMRFSARAGHYIVWLRGKSDLDNTTDSVWLQVDDEIETRRGGIRCQHEDHRRFDTSV